MKVEEVIASGLLESYVLGTSSAEETALIHELCKKHPQLIVEIEKTETALMQYAQSAAPRLGNEVKTRIFSNIKNERIVSEAKVIPLKKEKQRVNIYKLGMAASVLLFITSIVYIVFLQQNLGQLKNELSELSASKNYLAREVEIKQASIDNANQQLNIITQPNVKNITLKGMNSLLGQQSSVYWNGETGEVYFNSKKMPQSPKNKHYQLWAIVAGKPVDMGVIDFNTSGLTLQKMKSVRGAQAFAVTIEKMGGNATPSMETMCLLGNV